MDNLFFSCLTPYCSTFIIRLEWVLDIKADSGCMGPYMRKTLSRLTAHVDSFAL